jgi:hypothetical protein
MGGEPVTPTHLKLMNDMVRDIRRVTEEEGTRRGRPILIAGRCLENVEISRNTGLDVETWLAEDLVDLLSVAYVTEQVPPLTELITLADKHHVPVYPVCSVIPMARGDNTRDYGAMFSKLPVWRGTALSLYAQGAKGLQMFNVFDPGLAQWQELGAPDLLLSKDRTYAWDFLPSQRKGMDSFAEIRLTRFKAPVTVTDKGCEPIPLYVGEDLATADSSGRKRRLTLRLRVRGLSSSHGLSVMVNGRLLGESETSRRLTEKPASTWLRFAVKPDAFRKGPNTIKAAVTDAVAGYPVVDEARLDVRY